MRAIVAALTLTACASAPRGAERDRAAVIALVDQYHSVFTSHDFALLERIVTRDLLHVTASGNVKSLAGLEADLRDSGLQITMFPSDHHEVRVAGDAAVVVARIRAVGTRQGKPFDGYWLVSAALVRRDGVWRVQLMHATKLRDSEQPEAPR